MPMDSVLVLMWVKSFRICALCIPSLWVVCDRISILLVTLHRPDVSLILLDVVAIRDHDHDPAIFRGANRRNVSRQLLKGPDEEVRDGLGFVSHPELATRFLKDWVKVRQLGLCQVMQN